MGCELPLSGGWGVLDYSEWALCLIVYLLSPLKSHLFGILKVKTLYIIEC